MSDTLNAIAQSLSADVRSLATVSHNVANMSTPGPLQGRLGRPAAR